MRVIRTTTPQLELASRVDLMVVVGRSTSYQAQRIVRQFRLAGVPALLIEAAAELVPERFAGCDAVGLTAVTSTPDATMEAIHDLLAAMRPAPAPA